MIRSGVEGMLGPLIDSELNQPEGAKDGLNGVIGPQLDVGRLTERISNSSVWDERNYTSKIKWTYPSWKVYICYITLLSVLNILNEPLKHFV